MDTPATQAPRKQARPRTALIIAVVIVVLILITLVIVGNLSVSRYENYLSGLWVGDPGFLERAQLRDMQLFLGPREGGRRQGYLIMTDLSGSFISNQALEFREKSPAQRWWTALKSVFRASRDAYTARKVELEYDDVAAGAEPPMPEEMKMTVSMIEGTLTLFDGEKVYALFEKDLVASAAANEAYSS
jgi:hypothetical protein